MALEVVIKANDDHYRMATARSRASSPRRQGDANSPQITDCQIRTMIKSKDPDWSNHPEVFHTTGGGWKGKLKVQFYPVALATNPDGVRYLSNEILNKVLPPWKEYLSQRKALSYRHNIWMDDWSDWMKKEKDKLRGLKLSWPSKHVSDVIQDMGDPKAPTERLKGPNITQKEKTNGRGTKRAHPDEDTRHGVPNKRPTRLLERSNGSRGSKTSGESICSDEEMVLSQSKGSSS